MVTLSPALEISRAKGRSSTPPAAPVTVPWALATATEPSGPATSTEKVATSWMPGPLPRSELIEAPVPHRLTEVRGTLEEILGELGEAHVDCWTRVHVTDVSRPENLVARVRARLPHALAVLHEPPARAGDGAEAPHVTAADPFDVCCDFVAHVRGGGETVAPDETERAVLRRALENVLAAERSA